MIATHFAIRLLPAVLSMCVTALAIAMIVAREYGQYSYWLALANGLNVVFFHGTRHLVTFGTVLHMPPDIVTRGWQIGLCAALVTIILSMLAGMLAPVVGAGMLLLVAGQSVFERELAYCRASLHRWRYLAVACARPLISLGTLAFVYAYSSGKPSATAVWVCLAASPLLAVLPGTRDVWRRCRTRAAMDISGLRALASTAALLIPPAGFLFLANAVARTALAHRMSPAGFGRFSAISDIAMSAGWVVASAATWGFVAGALRRGIDERAAYVQRHTRWVTRIGAAACAVSLLIPALGPWPAWIDMMSSTRLLVACLLGAMTTCVLLPTLIIAGDIRRAWMLALAGTLCAPVLILVASGPHELDVASAARALLLTHAAVFVAASIATGCRKTRKACLAWERL